MYTIQKTSVERTGRDCRYTLHIDSLTIRRGQRIALVGPSGCGKSTALDLLALLLPPHESEGFTFSPAKRHEDIVACWKTRQLETLTALRLHHIGYILQTGGLLPFLSVRDNILLPGRTLGLPETHLITVMQALLQRLSLGHLPDAMPETLSIGERQRVAVARALLTNPDVVLADEPTAALDPVTALAVMSLLVHLAEERGTTLVVVSHDEGLMRSNGFHCLHMDVRGDASHIFTTLRG